jgi:Fungal specific transcription factor domain
VLSPAKYVAKALAIELGTEKDLFDEHKLPSSISQSIYDTAFQYFFMSYIPRSRFGYLSYKLDEFSSKSLLSSINAVALANLAREKRDNDLMHLSRTIYVDAIREVSSALQSEEEVSKNGTLVATMILGIFEAITYSSASDQNVAHKGSLSACFDNWIAHTNGTMSLLKFRGMKLLQTDFGKNIYFNVANKLRANCSRRRIRLPPDFVALDKQMAPYMQGLDRIDIDPTVKFWPVIDMTIELYARDKGKEVNTRLVLLTRW